MPEKILNEVSEEEVMKKTYTFKYLVSSLTTVSSTLFLLINEFQLNICIFMEDSALSIQEKLVATTFKNMFVRH